MHHGTRLLPLSSFFFFLSTIFASLVSAGDEYLLDCGSSKTTQLKDGRTFRSDLESAHFLSTDNLIRTSVNSIPNNSSSHSPSLPLYLTARIFLVNTTYTFLVNSPGPHWLRLYLYPLPHPVYNLSDAVFTVTAGCLVLLRDFSLKDNPTTVLKEYLINISTDIFSVDFSPEKNSIAFINAIELVSTSHLTSKERSRLLDGNCERGKSTIQMKYFPGFCLALGLLSMGWLAVLLCSWHKSFQEWSSLFLHSNPFCFLRTQSGQPAVRFFTLSQLKRLTHNFHEKAKIAKGGFGDVYIARWRNGTRLAIKKQRPDSKQGPEAFYMEVEVLSKVCHPNIIRLIGYCDEQSELALVYEYMKKGDFARRLKGSDVVPPLTWTKRLEVCIGAGRGLLYLHNTGGYIHRDIKGENILLDDDLTAKLADFGLCKALPKEFTHVTTQFVRGSEAFLDPIYEVSGQVSEKSDVHSFGVMLLEMMSSKCPTKAEVREFAGSGAIQGKMDTRLGPISPESLRIVVEAAKSCVSRDPDQRLLMGDLLHRLDLALKVQREYL